MLPACRSNYIGMAVVGLEQACYEVIRKVFARIEKIGYKMKPELLSALKFSRLSGNLPDCLETCQTVWKLARLYGSFLDSPESFRTVQKVLRQSGNIPDCLETFRTIRKLSRPEVSE